MRNMTIRNKLKLILRKIFRFFQRGKKMRNMTIKTQLKSSLKNVTDNKSKQTYKRGIRRFLEWTEKKGVKYIDHLSDKDKKELIQEYEKWLESECYSASTIHTYLAPICKGFDINMSDIDKPRRSAGLIKRSRDITANVQGKAEAEKEEFERLVNAQRALGIRRSELANLKGNDLIKTQNRGMYVRVRRGKGGKYQLQRVLPQHEKTIERIFKDVGKDENVFSCREMSNKIDLHGMRADVAKEAYDYYSERIKNETGYADELRAAIYDRYEKYNRNEDFESWRATWDRPDPYVLRGENRQNAINNHRPTEYDRLAMMAVSVFHLSHWRLCVTSVNYLT